MREAGTVSAVPASLLPGLERRLIVELAALAGTGGRLGAGPLDGCGGQLQRGGDLIGLDLDHSPLLAFVGLPGPQAKPADDDGPGTFAEGLGEVLRELPPAVDTEAGLPVGPLVALANPGVTARRKLATAAPLAVKRGSGSSVRLPVRMS
jgi:hypothetical protein